jgi:signal transduction histidine kinase
MPAERPRRERPSRERPSRERPRRLAEAIARRSFLVSAWPWRSLGYVLTTVPLAAPLAAALVAAALPWRTAAIALADGRVPTATTVVGLLAGPAVVAVLGPAVAVPLAALERRRLSLVEARPAPPAHRARRWRRYADPATWRVVAYALVLAAVAPLAYGTVALLVLVDLVLLAGPWLVASGDGPVAVGFTEAATVGQALPYALLGVALLPLLPYLWSLLAVAHAAVARTQLGEAGGDAALREVSRSRARLADAFEAERRRIERDLHDGAQHRLTSLTLQIAMARLDVPDRSPAAESLDTAHEQAKELMAVLRELIRGIRPQTLSERGLAAAIRELAGQSPIPVSVSGDLPERLPAPVESTAHFVASEALTNVAKHSAASRADVSLWRSGDLVVMEIRDDGCGGADPAGGSGLTGLADRVAAASGRLLLASPTGGPTLMRVELPCGHGADR